MVWFDAPPPPRATPQLSRDRVVGAAIELADRQPAGEITMRALAAELGVRSPMALYRYVGSKDGLADLMTDQVYGELAVPRGEGWRPALRGLGTSAVDVIVLPLSLGPGDYAPPPFVYTSMEIVG